jgi:hypothetical protein
MRERFCFDDRTPDRKRTEQKMKTRREDRHLTNISMRTTIDNEKKYAKLGKRILTEFLSFVEKANDQAILELVKQ